MTETHTRPAAFLGTSSDRIGSPEGTQAYYLTVAKHVEPLRLSPYVSVNYSEWDEGINFPFGANLDLGRGFSLQPMYDGERTHLLATFATDRWSTTFVWAWLEDPGVAVSFGF
jgi:hypothetical protein